MPTIETERLRMIPFTLDLMRAARGNRERIATQCHIRIPENWPGPELAFVLPYWIESHARESWKPSWEGLIVRKADNLLIGNMGLKGGPDQQGQAEVGYSILPAYHNQNYATEMLRALIDWSFNHTTTISTITAQCYQDNYASIRVLEKAGLQRQGCTGDLLRWAIHHP